MSKWYGKIGYGVTEETAPSVYTEKIVERPYFGDLTRNTRRLQTSDKVNDDINIANELSVVADPYACEHFYSMRYVTIGSAKWKITDVDVQYPRLILSLGGVYNEH